MVLRVEALKELEMPYCQVDYAMEGDGLRWRGEDFHLGWNLQKAGWETYMHFGAVCGHIGKTLHLPDRGRPLVQAQ